MKNRIMVLVLIAAAASVFALTAGTARADYGPLAVYQLEFSFNCNTPSFCGPDLGGFWGWGVLNSDGSVDAELTGCSHGTFNGATHFHVDGQGWSVSPDTGTFVIASETDTYVGRFAHVETGTNEDTGIPGAPGHYSTSELFGSPAPPGVAFQIEVVKIPNR